MMQTIRQYLDFRSIGIALLIAGMTSCNSTASSGGGNNALVGAQSGNYIQIERLARPAVKEAFQNFADHDRTNRSAPYADPTLGTAIKTFTNQFRAPQVGQTLAAILIPDELQADLSQTGSAAYLGVETGGATGSKFGGRALTDDVINTSLGAIFGKTLVTLGLVTEDNKEVPCLTTDNEPGSNTADGNATIANITAKNGVSTTFPYIGAAH